jgi:hypothetical protein
MNDWVRAWTLANKLNEFELGNPGDAEAGRLAVPSWAL